MNQIKNIVIAGGTHGNELSGVMLFRKWAKNSHLYADKCPSADTELVLTNIEATSVCKRYVDRDLNRSFADRLISLENPQAYEIRRAKELNDRFGPKGAATKTDLIIDVHNTTSNMGVCLILSTRDPFTMRASAEIANEFSNAFIYYQPEERGESPYFGTIAKADICLEVGPQPHGTLDADLFFETEKIVGRYLELADEWNRGVLQKKPKKKVDVFTQFKDIDYPRKPTGEITAMVHPNLLHGDYKEVKSGEPLFITFDGQNVPNTETQSVWPIFINESAYYEKKLAMSLTLKTVEEW